MRKVIFFLIILNFSCNNSRFNSSEKRDKGKIDSPIGLIKFVFIDLDGTLIRRGYYSEISKEDEEAIKRSKQKGARVIIATGRSFEESKTYYHKLDPEATTPIICMNGAFIYDPKNSRVIREQQILRPTVESLKKHVESNWKLLTLKYYTPIGVRSVKASDSIYKIVILFHAHGKSGKSISLDPVYKSLKEKFQDSLNIHKTPAGNLEITNSGVSKGEAIRHIKDNLDDYSTIGKETSIAIGDGENDISMGKEVSFIAMEGANDEVKKASNGVVSGVDEALKKYVLGEK